MRMLHKITLSYLAFGLALPGCGNPLEPKAQVLDLVVFGVYEAPDSATGGYSPKFYELTLTQVDLISTAGETVSFTPDDASKTLRIVDRPQIVLTKDIADYEETSFTSATVQFGADLVVGGKYQDDYPLTLSTPQVTTTESFTVDKGKGLRMTVEFQWRNTVVRDEEAETESIEQPSLTVETESQ